MPANDIGTDVEEDVEDFEDEMPDPETALKELHFRELKGPHELELVSWRRIVSDEPSYLLQFNTVNCEDPEDNGIEVAHFCPITGARRKEFTTAVLAITGKVPPKKVTRDFLDDLVELHVHASLRCYTVKKGENKGKKRNAIAHFLFGKEQMQLDEFLEK